MLQNKIIESKAGLIFGDNGIFQKLIWKWAPA